MSLNNRRILVIDDNKLVHSDFKKFLCESHASGSDVDEVAGELFGSRSMQANSFNYEVDSAYQGHEGIQLICKAREENRPYTIAFVDVRMPPGMDGVETAERILAVDSEIQIVICSAYSDYSMEEILSRFGECDRLLVLKKPFDVMAATMMVMTLNKKWHLARQANLTIRSQEERISDAQRVIQIVEGCNLELIETNDELRAQVSRTTPTQ